MLNRYSKAFTLIEIIVTVVVIGIIVSVSVLGYGQWQKSVASTQVKSDLIGVAVAMESHKNFNEEYPSDASSVFEPSSGVSISGGSYDGLSFCVDGSSDVHEDVEYYIESSGSSAGPKEGDCASRPLPPYSPPTDIVAEAQSHEAISLTWNNISGATSYNVEFATSNEFIDATLADSVSTNSTIIGGLSADTAYFFRIKSVNSIGSSDWSIVVSATTNHPPLEPPVIAATPDSVSQITVSWDSVNGATSYTLEYADNVNFTGLQTITGITGTSRTVSGLNQDTTYWFRAYSVNPDGPSATSDVVEASTASLSPPVIAATVNSVSQITVSWSAVLGATSYYVERATNSSFTSGLQTVTGITGTSRAFTGLTPNTTYWFRAYASSSNGDSGVSNVISRTTHAVTVPTSVTATLSGTAGAASYTSTCASGGTKEYRYAKTHRTDGSTTDNWGSWSSWSTTSSNTDFISQGMYGRVLVEARCNFSGHLSSSRYAKSAGEINQSNSGISGTVTITLYNNNLNDIGHYATGKTTCPSGFRNYVQLSLRSTSGGGGTSWAPSGNNRALDVTYNPSGTGGGTITARTNTARTSPWTNGRLPSSGATFSDPNPTSGWPPNAHNWGGGRKATVLYRCTSSYVTWRGVKSTGGGSVGKTPLNNSNISLSIQTISSRPSAESNLTSY